MNTESKGHKSTEGKDRWELLPIAQVKEVVRVLTANATSDGHTDHGWKQVENASEVYYAAALRHLVDWKLGYTSDERDGLSTLAHAICNLLFLMWHDLKSKGTY